MPQKSLPPWTKRQEKIGSVAVKLMSALNILAYRASGGRIGRKFRRGAPVLLLNMVGRKSGQARTVPLIYLADRDDLIVVASKGGMRNHPTWYLNITASPDVEVEIGTTRRKLRARRVPDQEKAEFWPRLTAIYRDYEDYQARTDRNIPVVRLSPT